MMQNMGLEARLTRGSHELLSVNFTSRQVYVPKMEDRLLVLTAYLMHPIVFQYP
jgi:hypothetical protein